MLKPKVSPLFVEVLSANLTIVFPAPLPVNATLLITGAYPITMDEAYPPPMRLIQPSSVTSSEFGPGTKALNDVGLKIAFTWNPNCPAPVPLKVPSVNPYKVIFSPTTKPCGVAVVNVATPPNRKRLIIFTPGLDPSRNVPSGKSQRPEAIRHSLIAHALFRRPQGSAP